MSEKTTLNAEKGELKIPLLRNSGLFIGFKFKLEIKDGKKHF